VTEARGDTTVARRRLTDQVITLVAFLAVAFVALVFERNIGFAAITAAVILTALFPKEQKGAIKQIAWPTVLLVAGVSCYAAILSAAGAPEAVGTWAAGLGTVLIGALVLCYVGGITSAFASSTALLPIIVPISIPLIATGEVSAVAVVSALAVSSTIVDVSPFSTNGALMVANRPDTITEEKYYKQVLYYSVLVTLVGPLLVWAVLAVPGWL
jgi:di/tricarboxylate transporter